MSVDRYILLLDGSTEVCSAALASEQSGILAKVFEAGKSKQSERLAPMVHEVLGKLPDGAALDAIVLAEGPGSYTGLRIVAGYAKGLCMALQIPLYTMTTTELLVHTFIATKSEVEADALMMPMIDARRMEVYAGIYNSAVESLTDIKALILTDTEVQESITEILAGNKAYFFGSGAEKAVELFHQICPKAEFYPNIVPNASAMMKRAFEIIDTKKSEDVTYWEPFYLKEYEAKIGVPNKVLQRIKKK